MSKQTEIIQGSDLLVGIVVGNAFSPVGHSNTCTIIHDTGELNNSDQGKEKSMVVNISAEGLGFYEDDMGYDTLLTYWEKNEPVMVRYAFDGKEETEYCEGMFVITNLQEQAPVDEEAVYSISMENVGEVHKIVVTPGGGDVLSAANVSSQTTQSVKTSPERVEYTDSVSAASALIDYITVSIGDISIAELSDGRVRVNSFDYTIKNTQNSTTGIYVRLDMSIVTDGYPADAYSSVNAHTVPYGSVTYTEKASWTSPGVGDHKISIRYTVDGTTRVVTKNV